MKRDNHTSVPHAVMLAACAVAIGSLVPVALYQCGAVDHLPDPPGRLFASDEITGSPEAHPLGVPDSLPGLVSYGATLALAMASPHCEILRRALRWKLLLDGGIAGCNVVKQFIIFKRACSWCMLTAAATAVMVPAGRKYLAGA